MSSLRRSDGVFGRDHAFAKYYKLTAGDAAGDPEKLASVREQIDAAQRCEDPEVLSISTADPKKVIEAKERRKSDPNLL